MKRGAQTLEDILPDSYMLEDVAQRLDASGVWPGATVPKLVAASRRGTFAPVFKAVNGIWSVAKSDLGAWRARQLTDPEQEKARSDAAASSIRQPRSVRTGGQSSQQLQRGEI